LVEIGLALALPWLAARTDLRGGLLAAIVVLAALALITVIDIEHRLILHNVSLPAAGAIAILGIFPPGIGIGGTLLGGLAGAAFGFAMFAGGQAFGAIVARMRGAPLREIPFGFGDVTFAGLIGLGLGWPAVVYALVIGVFAAGAFSLAFLLAANIRGRYEAFRAIPYGPFLALGAALVYFRVVSWLADAAG
jgi:leader peptidase (prepilin peptidase)/N-methyltransferase